MSEVLEFFLKASHHMFIDRRKRKSTTPSLACITLWHLVALGIISRKESFNTMKLSPNVDILAEIEHIMNKAKHTKVLSLQFSKLLK